MSKAPCPLRSAALRSPEAPAVVGRQTVAYRELDQRVSAAAERIRELGLADSARVALYLPKGERYVVMILALIRARCVAAPLSTRLPPQGVAPLLYQASCQALISDSEEVSASAGPNIRTLSLEDVLGHEPGRRTDGGTLYISLEQPTTIIFTSGSSGEPKTALHTFGNHYHSALGSGTNIPLAPGDRWLLSLPIYHVGGLSVVFRCLLAGATIALPDPGEALGESISRLGITHASLVATQLRRLLHEEVPGGLKALLLGGGPTPERLLEEAHARGLPVHTSYGLTEMGSQVTTTPPGSSLRELHTSGRALPRRELSIAPDGEVLVRGETLFAGYVDGERVERPVDEHGWFHTGDLGELDAAGNLLVRGRKDNLFVSGGENVRPEEIEEALYRLEGVERAAVIPVPDEEFGQRPVAFVRTPGGAPPSGELAQRLGTALPRFKVPVAFYEWPEDAEGAKVDRRRFQELARRGSQGRL